MAARLPRSPRPARRSSTRASAAVAEGFDQVAFGNLNELRAAVTGETCAILVEPVQGEGGIRPMSADYLKACARSATSSAS